MPLLLLEDIVFSFHDRPVLNGITLGVDSGEKIGLIGRNGCGKSTLLRIAAGEISPDSGRRVEQRGLRLARLAQDPVYDPLGAVGDYLLEDDSPAAALLKAYRDASTQVAGGDVAAEAQLAEVSLRMDSEGGWDLQARYHSLLGRFGLQHPEVRMGELSGGMRRKAALARALLSGADLLLLDEPTNHLDLDSVELLREHLQRWNGGLLMITHDRFFLESVCSRITEIDDGALFSYSGSYRTYLERKTEAELAAARQAEKAKSLLRTELEWLRRGAKARTTKQKARIQRIEALADRAVVPQEDAFGGFSSQSRRQGRKVVEMEAVSFAYGSQPLLDRFSYTFTPGEKIGLLGGNGTGKTTFLKLLTGMLVPQSGRIEYGKHTRFGWFDQHSEELDPEQTVLDYLRDKADMIRRSGGQPMEPGVLLPQFGFHPSRGYALLGSLSGGERRRLQLIRVLLDDPNFLVLDEPTNDLDLTTLTLLETFLRDFSGCVLAVSHDRAFLDHTVETLFLFDGSGTVHGFPGSCSGYLAHREAESSAADPQPGRSKKQKQAASEPDPPEKSTEGRRLTYRERLELEKIEPQIEQLEVRREQLAAVFDGSETDPGRIADAHREYAALEEEINRLLDRWAELDGRA